MTRSRIAVLALAALACLALAAPAGAATASNGLVAHECWPDGVTVDICVVDPATGESKNLTQDTSYDSWPSWSPDGTRIAYASDNRIKIMNADGTDAVTVVEDRFGMEPAWSPDGTRIAFVTTTGSSGYEVWTVPVTGATDEDPAVRLTDVPPHEFGTKVNSYQPTWSPDSSRIAFVSSSRDKLDACDIYAMDSVDRDGDGHGDNLLRLTHDDSYNCSAWEDVNPAWSPTGDLIAYSSVASGNADIWVMKSDGTEKRNATEHFAWDWMPGWSPDGRKVTFTSGRDGDEDIYSFDLADVPPFEQPTESADSGGGGFLAMLSPASVAGAAVAAASTFAGTAESTAAPTPTPVKKLTHNDTQDRASDWGAATDLRPRSRVSTPSHGGTYDRAANPPFTGTARDDVQVTAVQIALRQHRTDGRCRWWTGSTWETRACNNRRWVTVNGTADWSYRLPTPLPAHDPKRIRGYTVFSRARDSAGQWEVSLSDGRNISRFSAP